MRFAKSRSVVTLIATSLLLASCGEAGEQPTSHQTSQFGYAVNSSLSTTNAASLRGVATEAGLLSARLYPGVYVQGPSGQMIPNTDLASAQVLPGINRQVIYTINPDAKYSDGQPVVCDDFLLAATAAQMPGTFKSQVPLAEQIERVDCVSGSNIATVVFKEDQGERWRYLFDQGTVLPAHAIAAEAGITLDALNTALHNKDSVALETVAQIWNDGYQLESFNPALQVSFGPYKIDSVGEFGEVKLIPNEFYSGDKAIEEEVTVWPKGSDLNAIATNGNLQIADVGAWESEAWVNRDDPLNPYDIKEEVGVLTEQLTLASAGVLYSPEARQAFAACVDQQAVAQASSRVSGIEVPAVGVHSVRHQNPVAQQLGDLPAQHLAVDINAASALAGQTIRIGYDGPDERKAAMVEAIRVSCEPAGITVVDASEGEVSLSDLSRTVVSEWGYEQSFEGTLDAVLRAVDPNREYGSANSLGSDPAATRQTEEELWAQVPSIPLAAQPRVFVIDRTVGNVVVNTDLSGIGWNMDRWSRSED
ncbi:ABC transporter substrate-binding protein [Corynebacterium callunae]|uniref:ABC transporter substrate-binding protein n=1 Tax=Corynebacterium callunae TaxID=1721 RepID=UPI001FFE7CCE|nr:ABC transporter substrate-binding protein [Corynebacterium callunae]MCK2200316.1 ABC transporter substrate-binding protein [Corynebacterium callunae]